MKAQVWNCEKCGVEIDVVPMEAFQYRSITRGHYGAMFSVLNSELKTKKPGPWIIPFGAHARLSEEQTCHVSFPQELVCASLLPPSRKERVWSVLGSNTLKLGAKSRTVTQNKARRTNKRDFL